MGADHADEEEGTIILSAKSALSASSAVQNFHFESNRSLRLQMPAGALSRMNLVAMPAESSVTRSPLEAKIQAAHSEAIPPVADVLKSLLAGRLRPGGSPSGSRKPESAAGRFPGILLVLP